MLVMAERRRFTGGTAWHKSVRALFNLPIDKALERFFINPAIAERRNQCADGPAEHGPYLLNYLAEFIYLIDTLTPLVQTGKHKKYRLNKQMQDFINHKCDM
jgi:hypothetical protein